jgi:hypothetical protein
MAVPLIKTGLFKRYVSTAQASACDWWSRISSNYTAAHLPSATVDSMASTIEPSQAWGYREHFVNIGSTAVEVIEEHPYFACATAVVGTLVAANYARRWWLNRQRRSEASTGIEGSASSG